MGAAMLVGGLEPRAPELRPHRGHGAGAMLLLAVAALVMPAIFELVERRGPAEPGRRERSNYDSDRRGPRRRRRDRAASAPTSPGCSSRCGRTATCSTRRTPRTTTSARAWTVARSVIMLAIAGVAVGVMSEILVGSITEASERDRAVASSSSASSSWRSSATPPSTGWRSTSPREGQDGPVGQHRDRLERADRAVRGARARRAVVLRRAASRWPLVFNGFELGGVVLAVLIASR